MRIIAGKAKGTRLKMVPGKHVRPTADRVRESLFSVIEQSVPQGNILDLFAGTGALGLEALSRGAHRAVFVDCAHSSIETVKTNVMRCHMQEQATLCRRDARSVLRYLHKQEDRFSTIFLDPPYQKKIVVDVLQQIDRGNYLTLPGLVVVEHAVETDITGIPLSTLYRYRQLTYGDTMISLYSNRKEMVQ